MRKTVLLQDAGRWQIPENASILDIFPYTDDIHIGASGHVKELMVFVFDLVKYARNLLKSIKPICDILRVTTASAYQSQQSVNVYLI